MKGLLAMQPRKTVVTDVPGKPGRFWDRHTDFIGPDRPPGWLVRALGPHWADNLIGVLAAIRLFLRRDKYDGVVTSGGASGLFFAWLQRLIPWGRRPHVMIDCNWYQSPRRWVHYLKGLRLRLASPAVQRFVVWASHEVDDYAEAFGLPRQQLEYVPFHTTLDGYDYEIDDKGYLFAGGNYDRDYPVLIEAVRPLTQLPVWIATTRPEQLGGVSLPSHVRVEGTSVDTFRQALASARLVVVPMVDGLLHSGGQQTCLNAMYLGKPTIAVGRKWAVDLIEDGVDGLIVDYGDRVGLQHAIKRLIDHPEQAAQLAINGRAKARRFSTQATMQSIYNMIRKMEGVHGASFQLAQ